MQIIDWFGERETVAYSTSEYEIGVTTSQFNKNQG